MLVNVYAAIEYGAAAVSDETFVLGVTVAVRRSVFQVQMVVDMLFVFTEEHTVQAAIGIVAVKTHIDIIAFQGTAERQGMLFVMTALRQFDVQAVDVGEAFVLHLQARMHHARIGVQADFHHMVVEYVGGPQAVELLNQLQR